MKTIIITGASNGIGRAIAQELKKRLSYYKYRHSMKIIWKMLNFTKCDLSIKEDLLKTVEKIKTNIDLVYALINNAALFSHKSIDDTNIDEWEKKLLSVNLTAPYILGKRVFSTFKRIKRANYKYLFNKSFNE